MYFPRPNYNNSLKKKSKCNISAIIKIVFLSILTFERQLTQQHIKATVHGAIQ